MNNKGQATIAFFIAVMIGIIFAIVAATFVFEQQTVDLRTEVNLAIVGNNSLSTSFMSNDNIQPGSEVIVNSSGTTLVRDADYVVLSYVAGTFNYTGGNPGDGIINATYNTFPSGYIHNSTTRLLLLLVPLLIVLSIVVIVAFALIVK